MPEENEAKEPIEYWQGSSLKKEELINDNAFIIDAADYLNKRTNTYYDAAGDREEIYNEFIEVFRGSSVNEVSAIKDWRYVNAEERTDSDKEQMGKLFLTFDRIDNAETGAFEYIKDYGGAVLSAPSTYFGLGAGKVAGFAAGKGVSLLAKKAALKGLESKLATTLASKPVQVAASGVGTFAVEAGMEFPAAKKREATEVEALTRRTEGSILDEKDEENKLRPWLSAGLAGVSAGALSSVFRARGLSQQAQTEKLIKEASAATDATILEANLAAQKVVTSKTNKKLAQELDDSSDVIKMTSEQAAKAAAKAEVDAASKRVRKEARKATKALGSKRLKAPLEEGRVKEGEDIGETLLREITDTEKGAVASVNKEGDGVTRAIGPDFKIDLKFDTVKRISALAISLAVENGVKTFTRKGETLRITDILADQLDLLSKKLSGKEDNGIEAADAVLKNLMETYGLNFSHIAALFSAEFSNAGKTLRSARDNVDTLSAFFAEMKKSTTDKSLDDAVDMDFKRLRTIYQTFKNLDQVARGTLTMQPVTTIRNTLGGGLRVAVNAFNNAIAGSGQLAVGFAKRDKEMQRAGLANLGSSVNIFKYLSSPAEAYALREIWKAGGSTEAQLVFRAMADVTNSTPKNKIGKVVTVDEVNEAGKTVKVDKFVSANPFTDALVRGVRYMNALNTASDNFFKSAVFAAELGKSVGGSKKLMKLAAEGKLNTLPEKTLQDAGKEALFTAYQKGYKQGNLGYVFIQAFSQPFTSPFIPFPRFITNSLEFAHHHSPIIGAIQFTGKSGKKYGPAGNLIFGEGERDLSKRLAQQITGMSMLYGGFQLRAAMGDDTPWHQLDVANNQLDMRALLGPFALPVFIADIASRVVNEAEAAAIRDGKTADDVSLFDFDFTDWEYWLEGLSEINARDTGRELLKVIFGTSFKSGLNLDLIQGTIDDLINTGDMKALAKLVADYVGSFLNRYIVPVGFAKDILGTYDKSFLAMEDTRDVSLVAQMWKKATRSIPKALRDASGRFAFTEEEAKVLPTRTGIVYRGEDPAYWKNLTGMIKIPERNALEKELISLYGSELAFYRVFPKTSTDPRLSKAFDKMYGKISEEVLIEVVQSNRYNNLNSKADKRDFLKKEIAKHMKGVDVTDYFVEWARLKDDAGNFINVKDKDESDKLISIAYKKKVMAFSKDERASARKSYNVTSSSSEPSWTELNNVFKVDYIKAYLAER